MRTDKGHRQRVKDRFRKEGLDGFEESHALELLLFYAIPRRDTKPIARRLLDKFGSLATVMEAPLEALQKVEGVGPGAATFLKLIHETGGYYLKNRDQDVCILNDLNKCGDYLVKFFHGKRTESVWVLCMDAKCKLLACQQVAEGGVDSVSISPRSVMEVALNVNASSVILAHNHPGGFARPSDADIMTTKYLGKVLATMGLLLVDHFVVAEGDYISMTQSGLYQAQ